MTRWRLTVEYDGGPFMGWQWQDHGPSVQQALEEAIERMTGEEVRLQAAGRTDSGVHALAMTAHVDIGKQLEADRLRDGINALVRPSPVSVTGVTAVSDEWHARFSCIGRQYVYRILNRRAPAALRRGHVWHIPQKLNIPAMHEAAQRLVGQHDFTTFRSVNCQAQSPAKTLDRLDVEADGDEILVHAAARSFLHHQVRSMVGTLSLVGRGQWSADDVSNALEARDRQKLGLNAPPEGLYFVEATYPD